MKKVLIVASFFLTTRGAAQSEPFSNPRKIKTTYNIGEVGEMKQKHMPNLALGPSLIGLGGLLIAGGQVYLVNADNNVKTTTTILSAVGGASVFAGSVILGNALTRMIRSNSQARIKFNGRSVCIRL